MSLFILALCAHIGNLSLRVILEFGSAEFTSSPCYPPYSKLPHTALCEDIPVLLLLWHKTPDCPELSPHMNPPDSATPDTDFYFLPDFDLAHLCSFPRHIQQPAHPGPSRHSPEPSSRPSATRYPYNQWEQHLHSE